MKTQAQLKRKTCTTSCKTWTTSCKTYELPALKAFPFSPAHASPCNLMGAGDSAGDAASPGFGGSPSNQDSRTHGLVWRPHQEGQRLHVLPPEPHTLRVAELASQPT